MAISTSLPAQPSFLFATDEDCLAYAGGDLMALTPPWQVQASGADGVFAPDAPWVLTSASVDFATQGVAPNNVAWLTTPKASFPGGGHAFAVDSVAGHSVTLRRPYKDLNVGQPPAPIAGLTGVTFTLPTLGPQISEATYDLYQRFAIDANQAVVGIYRSPEFIYDPQVLRMATVYWVLAERYAAEARTDKGDFKEKSMRYRQKLDDAIGRIQVRFGPTGTSGEPATLFSCKISR